MRLLLLALYAAATLFLAVHHEPWRDEADSWLVVNNASLGEIFRWTRYAATPPLWYVLLKPLAWLGLPYFSQTALHLALAWSAAAVVVFFAPFTRLTKVLYLASYYPIYQYSVIARSYVLTSLLLFIAGALYPARRERPILYAIAIVLLLNTNIHGAVIAATLMLLFAIERPRKYAAIAIMAAALIVLLFELRPPRDASHPNIIRYIDPEALPLTIGYAFLPSLPMYLAFVIGLVVLAFIGWSLRKRHDALILLLAPLALFGFMHTFIWFGGYHHAGILLTLVIGALWIGRPADKATAILLNLTLLASAIAAIPIERSEITMAFSGAKEMGEFIRDHHLDRYELAGHKPYECEAVMPYLPGKQIWYTGLGRYGTYLPWDRSLREAGNMTYREAAASASRFFGAQQKPWLLLFNAKMSFPERRGFRLVYATRRTVFWVTDEEFWLYEPLRPDWHSAP
jgi:hypothetical protein